MKCHQNSCPPCQGPVLPILYEEWSDEYDHGVADGLELKRVARYIKVYLPVRTLCS